MATLNIQIVAGAATYGVSKTLSSGDLSRLLAAYTALFGTVTNDDTGLAWANSLIDAMKRTVHQYEQQVAVASAKASVSDIAVT